MSISLIKSPKISVAIKVKTVSFWRSFFWTLRGYKSAETPKISKIFAILLPKIFPMAIPESPFRLELMFTTSSGAEVPKATIVSPITISEMLNLLAVEDAQLTSISAPLIKNTNPRINSAMVSIFPRSISYYFFKR